MNRCDFTRADGNQCRAYAIEAGAGRCWNHAETPEVAEARAAGRAKGGAATAAKAAEERGAFEEEEWSALMSAKDCEDALHHVAIEVMAGRMGAREAAAATAAVKLIMVRCLETNRIR